MTDSTSSSRIDEPKPWGDDVALMGPDAPKNNGQIKHLIEYLLTVYKRFGNTAITCNLQWGASALRKRDEYRKRIEELESELAALRVVSETTFNAAAQEGASMQPLPKSEVTDGPATAAPSSSDKPRSKLPLSKRIENMFSFLYAEPKGNPCHFDHDFLDEVKAAAQRGCTSSAVRPMARPLGGDDLQMVNRALAFAGYDREKAHPACYDRFSYTDFVYGLECELAVRNARVVSAIRATCCGERDTIGTRCEDCPHLPDREK